MLTKCECNSDRFMQICFFFYLLENEHLKAVVQTDPCTTVRDLIGTISNRQQEIVYSKKVDKWLPYEMNENQNIGRFEVSACFSSRQKQPVPRLDYNVQRRMDPLRLLVAFSAIDGSRSNSSAISKTKIAPKVAPGNCLVVCRRSNSLQLS